MSLPSPRVQYLSFRSTRRRVQSCVFNLARHSLIRRTLRGTYILRKRKAFLAAIRSNCRTVAQRISVLAGRDWIRLQTKTAPVYVYGTRTRRIRSRNSIAAHTHTRARATFIVFPRYTTNGTVHYYPIAKCPRLFSERIRSNIFHVGEQHNTRRRANINEKTVRALCTNRASRFATGSPFFRP